MKQQYSPRSVLGCFGLFGCVLDGSGFGFGGWFWFLVLFILRAVFMSGRDKQAYSKIPDM